MHVKSSGVCVHGKGEILGDEPVGNAGQRYDHGMRSGYVLFVSINGARNEMTSLPFL